MIDTDTLDRWDDDLIRGGISADPYTRAIVRSLIREVRRLRYRSDYHKDRAVSAEEEAKRLRVEARDVAWKGSQAILTPAPARISIPPPVPTIAVPSTGTLTHASDSPTIYGVGDDDE